jgi:hypothetical protein
MLRRKTFFRLESSAQSSIRRQANQFAAAVQYSCVVIGKRS